MNRYQIQKGTCFYWGPSLCCHESQIKFIQLKVKGWGWVHSKGLYPRNFRAQTTHNGPHLNIIITHLESIEIWQENDSFTSAPLQSVDPSKLLGPNAWPQPIESQKNWESLWSYHASGLDYTRVQVQETWDSKPLTRHYFYTQDWTQDQKLIAQTCPWVSFLREDL